MHTSWTFIASGVLPGKGLIVAATALPANHPEYEAMAPLLDKAEKYGPTDVALIDRGYLASPRAQQLLKAGKDVQCKPWPSRNQGRFTKEDFTIDLQRGRLTCPAGATANISAQSLLAHFSSRTCDPCQLRTNCTVAQRGRCRSVAIHSQEELLMELRRRRRTSEDRAALRERVQVDALARLSAVEGPRARYKGIRKNTLDVRRCAAIVNLQAIARATRPQQRAA